LRITEFKGGQLLDQIATIFLFKWSNFQFYTLFLEYIRSWLIAQLKRCTLFTPIFFQEIFF